MSLPGSTNGYSLGPDEGEALWHINELRHVDRRTPLSIRREGSLNVGSEVRGGNRGLPSLTEVVNP